MFLLLWKGPCYHFAHSRHHQFKRCVNSEINDTQQEISAKFESLASQCKKKLENFFKNLNNKTASAMFRLTLHLDLSSSTLSEQAATHWKNVHEFLTARFQQTCKNFGEAMAAQLRRSVAAKQYSRLLGVFATTSERPLSASDNESTDRGDRRRALRANGLWRNWCRRGGVR